MQLLRALVALVPIASLAAAAAPAAPPAATAAMGRRVAALHLTRFERYGRARAILLREGWRPVPWRGDYRGIVDTLLRNGWNEVSNCSGTGLALCTFDWRRGRACARIVTAGETEPGDRRGPRVYDARAGACAAVLTP